MIVPIIEHLKLYELESKTVICKEGDIGTIFYVLIKGKIGVYKEGIPISTIEKPGTGFGELALTSESMKRSATLVASAPTTLITLAKEAYNAYLIKQTHL